MRKKQTTTIPLSIYMEKNIQGNKVLSNQTIV